MNETKIEKIAKRLIAGGKPINRQTEFFKSLKSIGVRSNRTTYKDKDGYFYQWDSLHGEWQCYNKRGKHLAVLDENGNNLIKDAIKGRKIIL